jgi:multifunctional methyltransferase subunit TRM112
MRLLSHNLLMCNVKNCDKNNFPLGIYVEKSQIIECEFRVEALKKLIPKLAWPALV